METAAGRKARGLPRAAGHLAGAEALRRIVEAAPRCGIGILTVYAFSSDNWKRPPLEVEALMALLACYLSDEAPHCLTSGVRMTIIGRRDPRLPDSLIHAIDTAERTTAGTAPGSACASPLIIPRATPSSTRAGAPAGSR